ncbi:unnamed protein product [Calypogeia fissa]
MSSQSQSLSWLPLIIPQLSSFNQQTMISHQDFGECVQERDCRISDQRAVSCKGGCLLTKHSKLRACLLRNFPTSYRITEASDR